jgi:hypothetical protein
MPVQKQKFKLKEITRPKRAGCMTQAVEHMPIKYEALSSNSSTLNKAKQTIQSRKAFHLAILLLDVLSLTF